MFSSGWLMFGVRRDCTREEENVTRDEVLHMSVTAVMFSFCAVMSSVCFRLAFMFFFFVVVVWLFSFSGAMTAGFGVRIQRRMEIFEKWTCSQQG